MYVVHMFYAFRAIGAKLRKQRIDDWWQPAKSEPEPKDDQRAGRHSEELHDTFAAPGVWALF
jgi:hypothetical protein